MGNINIEIPEDVHRKVKAFCALQGMTIKQFIISALEEKLKKDAVRQKQ